MKAIRVHQYGGPEVLRYEDIPVPKPSAGQARVKIEATGLNYVDIYGRTGLYQLPLPFHEASLRVMRRFRETF